MTAPEPITPRRRRRVWRLARRTITGIGVFTVIVLGAALWISRNLDVSWVKARLQAVVRDATGLELDYQDARADLVHGLVLQKVTLTSPPAYQKLAPELLRASSIGLGWSLFGHGPLLDKVSGTELELTVVVDEHGKTSLDSLGGNKPAKPKPPGPPSQLLADLVDAVPAFAKITIRRLTVVVLRTEAGRVVERTTLDGISAQAASKGSNDDREVKIDLGAKLAPLTYRVTHQLETEKKPGELIGHVWLNADLSNRASEVHGQATLDRQSLSTALPPRGSLFDLDVKAVADGDELRVAAPALELLDKMVDVHGLVAAAPGVVHVEKANGTVALGRVARLLPPERSPIALKDGHLHFETNGLEVSASPSLEKNGKLELDGSVTGLRWEHEANAVTVDKAKLTIRGKPAAHGGVQLSLESPDATVSALLNDLSARFSGVNANVTATLGGGQPGTVETRIRFAQLDATDPRGKLVASTGELSSHVSELKVNRLEPIESEAQLSSTVALGALTLDAPKAHVRADDVRLAVRTHVAGGLPGAVELESPIGRLQVTGSDGESLVPTAPAKLTAKLDRLHVDKEAPARSTAEGRLDLSLGGLSTQAKLLKRADGVDFDLALAAPRTALFTAFAPPALELPGQKMSLDLQAKGRVDDLFSALPRLVATSKVHLGSPSVTLREQTLSADVLDVELASSGTARRQDLTVTVRPQALALEDEKLGNGRLTAHAVWDAARPSIDVRLDGDGQALPSGQLQLAATFDHKKRTVAYRIEADLGHLAAVEPLLPASLTDEHWIDLSDMRAHLLSHGEVAGLLASVDRRGVPRLTAHPLDTLRGDDELELTLEQVHYVDDAGVELVAPSLAVKTRLSAEGPKRTATVEAHLPKALLTAKGHKLDFTDLVDQLTVTVDGDPRSGAIVAQHRFTLGRLGQDALAFYPVAALSIDTHAHRSLDGALHLDDFELVNQAAGTKLSLKGDLLLPRGIPLKLQRVARPLVGWRSLAVNGRLEQRLDGLSGDAAQVHGSGTVVLTAELASGDLRRFHVNGSTKLSKATFELPQKKVKVTSLDGELPVIEDFVVERGKARLIPQPESNVYSLVRFADQQPFLSKPGALSADRVQVGDFSVENIAGNLRIARNLFALEQLDATFRHGHVSGQLVLDYKGADSAMQLRLRATGVEAIHGGQKERFDGNAALELSMRRRTVDGRAEILRIGRHHLLELLDEYDPHHNDAATNRVRTALGLGYPDRVRLLFDRGFASLSVSFGGLAKLVTVHDVHGIPVGPLVERYLGPLLSSPSMESSE